MVIYVDIDNTIFNTGETSPYERATPIEDAINKINQYYEDGNTIILWTARGSGRGLDQYLIDLTERQLKEFGVKYHELKFGKPVYDMFFDDKAFNATELLK